MWEIQVYICSAFFTIPDDLNITLEKALEIDKDLLEMYNSDEEAKRVIDLGKRVEGSIRNTGIRRVLRPPPGPWARALPTPSALPLPSAS